MSDSEHSTITYTSVSEDDLYMGSPGVEVPIYEGPPSPDYVPGPEEPEQAPPSPIYIPFVPEPVYPEFLPVDDEVFPAEEQPLPAADSPTHQSPGYIPESDPEEDLEEDDEEDPEEDPADYPADRGDDDDDALALAEPAAVAYSADQDPYIAYRVAARMSIRTQAPTPFLSEEVAERVLALPTPPPSPLSPYSSPLPQIPSPPLPIPPPSPISPTYVEGSLGSRAAGIRQRDALPVGESSAAGTARQVGPATARADLYGFADMLDAAPGRQTSREFGLWVYGVPWDDLSISCRFWASRWMRANQVTFCGGISLRTTVMAQQSEITELQAADRRRQSVISDLLKADHRRQRQLVEALKIVKSLKTQMIELQRQQGHAKVPESQSYLEEAIVSGSRLGYDCSYYTPTKYYEYISASMALGVKNMGTPREAHEVNPNASHNQSQITIPQPSVTSAQLLAMIDKVSLTVIGALLKAPLWVGDLKTTFQDLAVLQKPCKEAIEMQTELMDKRMKLLLERTGRKQEDVLRDILEIPKTNTKQKAETQEGLLCLTGRWERPLQEGPPLVDEQETRDNGNAVARAYASGVEGKTLTAATIEVSWSTQFSTLIILPQYIRIMVITFELADGDNWVNTETGDKVKKEATAKDVPIVKSIFRSIFPEDLARSLHTRQVEFHSDLVPGAAPGQSVILQRSDLRSGITIEDRFKKIEKILEDCASKSRYGHYVFLVMPFEQARARRHLEVILELLKKETKIVSVNRLGISCDTTVIRQFCGLAGYYRCSLKGFKVSQTRTQAPSKEGSSLSGVTNKKAAFQLLIARSCVVATNSGFYPKEGEDFIVYCDALITGFWAAVVDAMGKVSRVALKNLGALSVGITSRKNGNPPLRSSSFSHDISLIFLSNLECSDEARKSENITNEMVEVPEKIVSRRNEAILVAYFERMISPPMLASA
ncbi:hypothetical protein Tco_0143403 [Tanacetum coccineum]